MKKIIAILFCVSILFAGLYDYPYLVNSNNNQLDQEMDKHLFYGNFEKILRFKPVFFHPSTNEIKQESQDYLEEIVKTYEKYKEKDIKLTIIGYTDHVQTQTEKVNQSWWYPTYPNDLTKESSEKIALQYANYVHSQLLHKGVPKGIMIVEQRGGLDNLYTKATQEGRDKNYRAMVTLYIAKDKNTDSDNDGVIDTKDKCPFTPQGHEVNIDGCSEILNLTVYYDLNSPQLIEESREKLEKVIAFMKKYPHYKVLLYGHTSSEGRKLDNQILSEKRAIGVRKYLIEKGIQSSRISAYGKASLEPVQSKDVPEIPELNRRVEIKLY